MRKSEWFVRFLQFSALFLCFCILFKEEPKKLKDSLEPKRVKDSIYDHFNFSLIDKPQLWRDGNYKSLYELDKEDMNEFLSFKEVQYEKRRYQVQQVCKNLKKSKINSSKKSQGCIAKDQRCLIVVDPGHKLGFCRNPKVSSSTWLARFKILIDNLDFDTQFTIQERNDLHESSWSGISTSKKFALLKRQSILSFVFVRHPFDRIESAYYDKITGEPTETFKMIVESIKKTYNASSSDISPEDFVRFVIDENLQKSNLYQVNEHWRPQSATCPFCAFNYKVYGHFETLEEDTAFILHKSKLLPLLKVGKLNVSKHSKSRREDFWSKIPNHFIKDLYKVFQTDFDMFQY